MPNLTVRRLAKTARHMLNLTSLGVRDFRREALSRYWPMKPSAISFMANDICNSKCEMCLIWEKKRDHEVTPDEFRGILSDSLFSHVEDLGVTGGEPTLRNDLPELFRVACQTLPRLRHCSTITNAIKKKQVLENVMASAEICRSLGKSFSVMISIDGVGEVHDLNRGKPGNFQSAVECFEAFEKAGIRTLFGCTFTTLNSQYADEMLDYAIERGWYGRFRVAEFIDRLYNNSMTTQIRAFNDLQAYNLGLFFFRAGHQFEKSATIRKTYRSILGMIAEGKKRATGCPYHHQNVILTSRGELLYCSPKSPILGNALGVVKPSKIFFDHLSVRDQIKKDHCGDCIHDYHVPETFSEKLAFWQKHRTRGSKFGLKRLVRSSHQIQTEPLAGPIVPSELQSKCVLIVGWYGTETVGDKAILWTIVERLRRRASPPSRIMVSSLHSFITHRTKVELDLPELEVVETYSSAFETACDTCDEVVIGGGPLMHLDALDHMLYAFQRAKQRNAIRRVEGCGIGPLEPQIHRDAVKAILRLSSHTTLRDNASVQRAKSEFEVDCSLSPDPATDYVLSKRDIEASTQDDEFEIACFLRAWDHEYAKGLSASEFDLKLKELRAAFVDSFAHIVRENDVRVRFFPMHSFSVGGDDRVLARAMFREIQKSYPDVANRVSFQRLPASPIEIIRAMKTAKLSICMRFHSVLFAETLGVPYLAIDYTNGGKIEAFLRDKSATHKKLTLEEVIRGELAERCRNEIGIASESI